MRKSILTFSTALAMAAALTACSQPQPTLNISTMNTTAAAENTEAATEAETKASESAQSASEAAESATDYKFTEDITIICPVKAGGDTDRNTRVLAETMQKYTGVNVIVKNVDGGATVMGMQECLDAKPDGNTLVCNGTDMFVPYLMGTSKINIDSFRTIGIPIIDNTTVLAVNAASGWNTLEDLLKASAEAPDSIEYGGKIGATNQICGIAMNKEWNAGLKFVDVGNNAAKMTALLGQQTDVINISYSLANDYFETGEFIPLCLLGTEKNPLLPKDCPLADAYGLKNLDFSKYFWVGTGPDVPDEKVEALQEVLKKVVADPDFVSNIESNYLTVCDLLGTDAQEYANSVYENSLLIYKDDFLSQQ